MQKVQKELWKSAEEPLEALLTQLAPSHASIRRELMIALAQTRYRLNRDPASIQEAVDVRFLCSVCCNASSSCHDVLHAIVFSLFQPGQLPEKTAPVASKLYSKIMFVWLCAGGAGGRVR